MKVMLLAVFLFSLQGLSLAESDTDPLGELSATQLKSMRKAGLAVLTARAKATEDPDIEQFRQGIQSLRQELRVLATQPVAASGGVLVQAAGKSSVQAAGLEAKAAVTTKAKQNATKQRIRNVMAGLRDRHNQLKLRRHPKGPLPDAEFMNNVSVKLIALQAELDDALAKSDVELRAACKALLTRIETQHLMIGQPLDDQPTLTAQTRHRR